MPGFKSSPQPPNSSVANPHDVAEESYEYWTETAGFKHIDACSMLANENEESSFRWSYQLKSGSFVGCIVGDNGHAFGAFQHHWPRIRELRQPLPHGCEIDISKTAETDPSKGATTHLQNLSATYFEITRIHGYRDIAMKLFALKTAPEKVAFLVRHFEQSGDQENDIRKRLHDFDYWNTYFGRLQRGNTHG